jgi:hypothetical protein
MGLKGRIADNSFGKVLPRLCLGPLLGALHRLVKAEQGWLKWTHARQLTRVQRVTEDPATGKKTVGNRTYVSSETPAALEPRAALRISRAHFRCEDETHWTASCRAAGGPPALGLVASS